MVVLAGQSAHNKSLVGLSLGQQKSPTKSTVDQHTLTLEAHWLVSDSKEFVDLVVRNPI